MTIIEHLQKAIRDAALFNPDVQAPPVCILWPDRDRQWEAVISRLQNEMPELFILGNYDPGNRTGPAIWLRCVIANKADDCMIPEGKMPILYLPSVGRQGLRAVEDCPEHLRPLAELQYRGVIWSQVNVKDWTILAFLKSSRGGLGLDVAQDNESRNAMQRALYRLMDEDIDFLRGKRLDKDYFNTLLTGGDPVRDLLQWLDQDNTFRTCRGENEWRAFAEVCKSQFAFDPENDGILAGATRLAAHTGPWRPIWERFCEAPAKYPNIPARIRKTQMPLDLFSDRSGWPQWNEKAEVSLRKEFLGLKEMNPHDARRRIAELEKQHSGRRNLVWAELGESPLALVLEHLALLAETTASGLAAGSAEDLATGYSNSIWRTDDAMLRALACVEKQENFEAVCTAIRAVYLPWAEESARHLQKIVEKEGYPGGTISSAKASSREDECIIFVDGLRFDAGRRLADLLTDLGCKVEEKAVWAALPSVTATGKPAVTPVREKIRGNEANSDFEPCVAETGQSLKGGYNLKKLLADAGWEVLGPLSNGNGHGHAWCESGNIDREGHNKGWKLAVDLEGMLKEIKDRILQLLEAGWKSVRIVTDHGWLLLPGGLPKIDMPGALAENKWGRCAAIKEGAVTAERLYPWYWNPGQDFALADGISCFRKGNEYVHGGLSLQECLTLELTVSAGASGVTRKGPTIIGVVWKGLRCTVAAGGEFSGLSLDIRTQPGNKETSVVENTKLFNEQGTASVVIKMEKDELEGTGAFIVLLDTDGGLMAQTDTVIGGGNK